MAKFLTTDDGYGFWQAEPGDDPVNRLYAPLDPQSPYVLPVKAPVQQDNGPIARMPTESVVEQPTHNLVAIDDPFEAAAARNAAKYANRNMVRQGSVLDTLTGVAGGERLQTWPERLVRSGVGLAHDVMTGEVPTALGLRREDFTDAPLPTVDSPDATWLGKKLGLAPVAWQPNDEIVARAQDMAGLAGGGALVERPSAAPIVSSEAARLARADRQGYTRDAYHGTFEPEFKNFDPNINPSEMGSHFGTVKQANDIIAYTSNLDKFGKGARIVPVKLDIKNPLRMQDLRDWKSVDIAKELLIKGFTKREVNNSLIGKKEEVEKIQALKSLIQKKGYDGVVYRNDVEGLGNNSKPQDSYIAFKPEQIRSKFAQFDPKNVGKAGLLLSDSATPGAGLAAVGNAPRFYSAVENAVTSNPQTKMSGQQWLGTLKNAKGVKAEEMDWIGLNDFLANKPNVTKQEINDYIVNNKVELQEVGKGDNPRLKELNDKFLDHRITPEEYTELEALTASNKNPTRYSDYQLAGGTNYKEQLISLPDRRKPGPKTFKQWADQNNLLDGPEARSAYMKWMENNKDVVSGNNYKSSHWEEPNIVAHVRSNDRIVDGKPSLHLEEIQSDWHQQGREKGYKTDLTPELKSEGRSIEKKFDDYKDQKLVEKIMNHENELEAIQMAVDAGIITPAEGVTFVKYNKAQGASALGVPNAPFKKTWHELAIKRMIREAAERGMDRLSWTPGEHHNRRYPGRPEKEQMGMEYFYDKMLPSYVEKLGKEHGVKVKKGVTNVDSEGWRIIPANESVSGKWTVKNSNPNSKGMQFDSEAAAKSALDEKMAKAEVHYIDIPDKLKSTALEKGFPLFVGNHMLVPLDSDPFTNKEDSSKVSKSQ